MPVAEIRRRESTPGALRRVAALYYMLLLCKEHPKRAFGSRRLAGKNRRAIVARQQVVKDLVILVLAELIDACGQKRGAWANLGFRPVWGLVSSAGCPQRSLVELH
jgi:hypothetical protein